MKSYVKPTSDQLDAVMPRLSSPQHESYFFSRLENPLWITPLAERNVFKSPPKADHVKGGGVRFPLWPPSRYLAKMAAKDPVEVARIFAKIKTDNASIIGDLLDAALVMPAGVAVSLVPSICQAVKEGTLWIHFNDASDLCVRLAEGGELDAAMELANTLFTPKFENGQEEPRQLNKYWYKDGLSKIIPVLVKARSCVLLPNLCDWLKVLVKAKERIDSNADSDYSYSWRPAIEEHEQNHDYDFVGAIVGFVRQGFELAIRNNSLSLDEALQIVNRYSYLVFKRLEIHLINEFSEQNSDLACQTILTRELFGDYKFKHEYAMLVGRRLDLLSNEQRDQWFGWIDAGPDMSNYDESNREATDKDRRGRIDWWKYEKLHCVRNHLDGERREFYEKMLTEHGEPELADLNSRISPMRSGHESPMVVDDLVGRIFEDAVDEVSLWRPDPSQFMGPSLEGLASTFEQYVATEPEQFSAKAMVLAGKPAIFVCSFISQMSKAVGEERKIDLPAVVELCRWAVDRPVEERTTFEQENEVLVDKNWQWTRGEVLRFVETVSRAKIDKDPRYSLDGLRKSLWYLVEQLCQDRAESLLVHGTTKDDPRIHDYLNFGINSSRGKAVEAALEYARWVANHIKKSDGKQEIVPDGFDAMPEVRKLLDWQIKPENRTFEAMSIIGSRISLIYWIDKEWLAKNAGHLFHLQGIEETPPATEGWAAWNAFIIWVRPHVEFYRLFKSQFAYAVEQAQRVKLIENTGEQPMNHLGEHLMSLYGCGQLGLDDDDGLLRRFITEANPEVRRHTIRFVGQNLKGDDEKVPEVVERFQALWHLYWTGPGEKDAQEKPNAQLFGIWFSCGYFPDQWAFEQLEQFVEVVPMPEPDFAVVVQLAKLAPNNPMRSVHILDLMIRGDQESWRVDGWLDSAEQILKTAMQDSDESRTIAKKLIDHLGRMGYITFRDLLKPNEEE